jgi:anti-sigma regulatory factor (Ser/Thr protein kinase)
MQGLNLRESSERSRWTGPSPAVRIPIVSDADIIIARQRSREIANAMRFSSTDSAFIATTVSELARLLLSRTERGEIWLQTTDERERSGVVIVARDPVNSSRAAVDRHAPSRLGPELPDLIRLVDELQVTTEKGQGTTIRATKWCRRRLY